MKKTITILLIFIFQFGYSQNKYECSILSENYMLSKYNHLKKHGLNYKFPKGDTEVIPEMIKILQSDGLRQICIDAEYYTYRNGIEQDYVNYYYKVKKISENDFVTNYVYLNILSRIVDVLENNTNYKRTY